MRRHVYNRRIGSENHRYITPQRNERYRRYGIPHESETVGGTCVTSDFQPIASAVGVADAYCDGRSYSYDYHECEVGYYGSHLIAGHFVRAEPAHHDAYERETAAFHEHLQGYRRADSDERFDRGERKFVPTEKCEIAGETVSFVEVRYDEYRRHYARYERAQSCTCGTHFRATEVAVDEQPVADDIDDIGSDNYGHRHFGVTDAFEKLFESGAWDVHFLPCFMKKNRPAYRLSIACHPQQLKAMQDVIFKHTTSIGLRYRREQRTILNRQNTAVMTPFGEVRGKVIDFDGSRYVYPEYEDVKAIAQKQGLSIRDVFDICRQALNA